MQTLAALGTFEDTARKLLAKGGFDDMLDFWPSDRRRVESSKAPEVCAKFA